ncbi:hypothetical protein [Sphingomonas sp.]|uniref:hypothetical protein n=1 Tax=Sphingomonas sp. TaxID=28214 RepID=UPI002DEEBC0D|nr:hypothetical protein [Sphingomonas sp.]
MVDFAVVEGDILERTCDLLLLKHAAQSYGVDRKVAQRTGADLSVEAGNHLLVPGTGIAARQIMVLGVGSLIDFRYGQIRRFAAKELGRAATFDIPLRTLCSPVHGPGYGLDEKESFLSLIAGFMDAIADGHAPHQLKRIEIVERNPVRRDRFAAWLHEFLPQRSMPPQQSESEPQRSPPQLRSFGDESEAKAKMFVAMPFADDYSDVYEVAIQDASLKTGIVCERLLEHAYLGDIVQEIKTRIAGSHGLIGVLDGLNPNVFLEVGFAWGLGKPTLLIVKEGQPLPFNVQGQKCLTYKNIGNLRSQLIGYLEQLKATGTFGKA